MAEQALSGAERLAQALGSTGPRASHVLSTSAFLLFARMAGAGAGFLVQLILARFLSAHDLGIYFAATSLAVIGGVIAAHGYPSIATRFVSRYRKPSGAPLLRAFVRHAQRETFVLALAATALIGAGAFAWPSLGGDTRVVVALGAAMIPFVAAFRLYGSLATATRAFVLAYLPDVCLKPIVLLAAIAAIIAVTGALSLPQVMLSLALATIVLSIGQLGLLARGFPVAINPFGPAKAASSASMVTRWRREAHAVLLVALFSQFFPDLTILIATPVLSAAQIGVFGLCLKLAFLIGFFVALTQNLMTPDLADALAKRSERAGNAKFSSQCLASTGATLMAMLACILWGDRFLALFGTEFEAGKTALVVLVGAQLVRAVFGPTNAVLTLVGEQRLNLLLAAFAVAILAASVVAGSMLYGIGGAAAAVLVTTLAWSVASAWLLHRKYGVRVDLFAEGFGRARRRT
jgi:O-antigen/teichoic acid export membrane protein